VESEIMTPKGIAILEKIDVFKQEAILKFAHEEGSDEYVRMGLTEINELIKNVPLVKNENAHSD